MKDDGRERRSRQVAVQQAEAYIRAHLDTPIPLARLSRIVGLSERGLRSAFYGIHGMPPKRWMVTERLLRAQSALTNAEAPDTTVTRVAIDHGFFQLGRFAAIYRAAFGETPSDTLRAAQRPKAKAGSTTAGLRGHVNVITQ